MYFFENKIPRSRDLVVCKIIDINEFNIILELLEYNNLKAFLSYKELNQKSMYKIKKMYKINMITTFEILNFEKDVILVTKSNLKPEENIEHIKKFNQINKILNCFKINCESEEIINKTIKSILKSYNDYDEIIRIFYIDVEELYSISVKWNNEFLSDRLKKIFKPLKREIIIDYDIKSDKYFGLTNIKNKLDEISNYIHSLDNNLEIKCIFLGSPNYRFIVNSNNYGANKNKMELLMSEIIKYNIDDIINYKLM